MSSTEAEIIAALQAALEIVYMYLRALLREMGVDVEERSPRYSSSTTRAYSSKKQKCIALSSTEAQLIAASAGRRRDRLPPRPPRGDGAPAISPDVLHVDNTGAVDLAKDAKTCHRSRHVLRRFSSSRCASGSTTTS